MCSITTLSSLAIFIARNAAIRGSDRQILNVVIGVSNPRNIVVLIDGLSDETARLNGVLICGVFRFITNRRNLVLGSTSVTPNVGGLNLSVPVNNIASGVYAIVGGSNQPRSLPMTYTLRVRRLNKFKTRRLRGTIPILHLLFLYKGEGNTRRNYEGRCRFLRGTRVDYLLASFFDPTFAFRETILRGEICSSRHKLCP